jgi:hypothetical protein
LLRLLMLTGPSADWSSFFLISQLAGTASFAARSSGDATLTERQAAGAAKAPLSATVGQWTPSTDKMFLPSDPRSVSRVSDLSRRTT